MTIDRDRAAGADHVTIAAEGLSIFAVDLLRAAGVPEGFAFTVAHALVAADLEDAEPHGVLLLPLYLERIAAGSVSATAEGRIISDRGGAVVLDAENGLGQVTARTAWMLAVDRASEHGVGAVAVRNAFHFGSAGYWARRIAEAECVGIVMCNTRPLMPAPGGAERVVGNNPLAIAVPSDGQPVVVDVAMSATAMQKIRLAAARGERLPEGLACDANGNPTTDPAEAIKGMLLPAAGPKGFGLALLIDMLAGGLSAGAMGDAVKPLYGNAAMPYASAHFFLALNIHAFRPLDEFASAVTDLAQRVRASRPAAGAAGVRVPGDRATRAQARNDQKCRISLTTAAALRQAAERLNVTPPSAFTR